MIGLMIRVSHHAGHDAGQDAGRDAGHQGPPGRGLRP